MTTTAAADMDVMSTTAAAVPSFVLGNANAIMKSGRIWAAGCQALSQTMAETARDQVGSTMSTWVALMGAKSFQDAVDLRATYAQEFFGFGVAGTRKIAGEFFRLIEETMAPMTARVAVSLHRLKS